MASSPEAIAALVTEATAPGFRDDLLAKGQARAMISRDGALPEDAPKFSDLLKYDLLSYAYTLLTQGLRLLDRGIEADVARTAFENAASAIEAAIARGQADSERDFHRFAAAACYHLAGYSARAYSLLHEGLTKANLSFPERALALLMLRDLGALEALIADYRLNERGADGALIGLLSETGDPIGPGEGEDAELDDERLFDAVDIALSDHFLGAMGEALLAFERGEHALVDSAVARLQIGLDSAGELRLVPQWWCHRFAIHLLRDLWASSFHERLPPTPPQAGFFGWEEYRELFIATLLARERAEIDLWPSQMEAAARALDLGDNMVVSLPTSAGKTRIAELCILACLASGRRVVFVTPLRALSAQTEVTLQRTFQPLGKTVSSLYGAIGVSEVDENFLRESDIIVATPEKLDFALRNDPDLLDDVGLVVLDEGHMIGLTEREVRYEVQIQRLLRRPDAKDRRIVCLSAILPDGKQLEDFTAWLTRDHPGGLVKKNWRPTRLRYGEVIWKGDHARLDITIGAQQPWIENFLTPSLPKGRKTRQFPFDQRELCIATAWALVADQHSVLIFCPLRRSVEPFAKAIVDLAKRGTLSPVLEHDPVVLENALAVGAEWLGKENAILECLRLGVAVHHGALPTAFRKEIERLLRKGVLKVTISSPTLAQGLNLSATTLIFHGLNRSGELIDIAEFRNVVGRAGRAYVDVEGLVLLPMFDRVAERRVDWRAMIDSAKGKEMESGLLRLVMTLLLRMMKKHRPKDVDGMLAYLTGSTAWDFPVLPNEKRDIAEAERTRWNGFLTTLDTAILSMLGEREVADDEIETTLDEVLHSSLWSRRMLSRNENDRVVLTTGLVARTRFIWSKTTAAQRRGYFLAGVGLATGEKLDLAAAQLNELLVVANVSIVFGETDGAIAAITAFAEIVLEIDPFAPDGMPANWRSVLRAWLSGDSIASFARNNEDEVLQFVEQTLVYRLSWAMEAVRVRAIANDAVLESGITMEDIELGHAVAAVETGTLSRSAGILMHAGFSSRSAAISAVEQTNATFTTMSELRRWLSGADVADRLEDPSWPTRQSNVLWRQFVESFSPDRQRTWGKRVGNVKVRWSGREPNAGMPLRLYDENGQTLVLAADYSRLGVLRTPLDPKRVGLALASVAAIGGDMELTYLGPDDLYPN